MRKSSTCCGPVALRARASAGVALAVLAAACSRPAPAARAAAAERPAPERALELARRGGDVAELERQLQAGTDVNQRDGSASTLLALAAAGGHVALVDALLERGARVDTHDSSGQTPLTAAVRHGHGDVVKRLLKDDATKRALDRQRSADQHEMQTIDDVARYEAGLRDETQRSESFFSLQQLLQSLLKKAQSELDSPERDSARRVLRVVTMNAAERTGDKNYLALLEKYKLFTTGR